MSHDAGFNMLNLANIEKLNGNNFNTWKQHIEMNLGMLKFNVAFKTPQPTTLVDGSIAQENGTFCQMGKSQSNAEVGTSLSALINSKHDGSSSVSEHVLKMVNISNKLNAMEIGITEQFLMHIALYSLSGDVNQLIAICCQEAERLKKSKAERMELANLLNIGKGKGKMIVGNENDNYKGNKPSRSRTTPNATIECSLMIHLPCFGIEDWGISSKTEC
ncbi:hypothetical protein D8674_013567 [Pyrus ussuriensis x Pyrus communis]|uniref:Uncharacterized protein n=1 Tax=Pyrus ussuriensis x Pyrus communis TaxID=2448454 RepID=A0A5N5GQZ8_9ROSA|nr:hypothetical protein D8674_013567 [Pyrus ussuriensis x Pyrus communis]